MGDKLSLVSEDEIAFLSYADTGRSVITKGDPIGDPAAGERLIWPLRDVSYREGKRVAFYSVLPKFLQTYLDLGMSALKIGDVARMPLTGFTLDGSGEKGIRHAKNRAKRDGFIFEIVPADQIDTIWPRLKAISDAWLAQKHGSEKRFSLGAFTDGYMRNFDTAVLHNPDGEIVAFANLFKGGRLSQLSIDFMRYDPTAPSFVMNALFAEMMLWGAAEGYESFSLCAAPFSGMKKRPHASVWTLLGTFVFEHGADFYHFEGLRALKEKFVPAWTTNHLTCPSGRAASRVLNEINLLVSGGIRGLAK